MFQRSSSTFPLSHTPSTCSLPALTTARIRFVMPHRLLYSIAQLRGFVNRSKAFLPRPATSARCSTIHSYRLSRAALSNVALNS